MTTEMPTGYYDRTDATKNYDRHLFVAGKTLQSAELNEIQANMRARVKSVADAIFKDGDIVRDARIVVDPISGATICESGAIYLSGAVRGIASATITIPVHSLVTVGVYLRESVITSADDAGLLDPAIGLRNYQEAGAARLKVEPVWGYYGDGGTGDFFPVYQVDHGSLLAKEAPPNYDAMAQSIARYDRDSSGGTYVVSGFTVAAAADLVSGEQVYTVSEGRARVNGYGIEQSTSRRLVYDSAPDLRSVDSEPFVSASIGAQRVNLSFGPVYAIASVHITATKTVTLTHGGYTGAQDALPDSSVLSITSVTQGGTTYTLTTDYKLTSNKVDWTPSGAEPATGSTYSVTYQYIASVTPTAVDTTGFTVTGAVVGTLVLTTYTYKLPRIDRLAIDGEGHYIWLKGVAADWNPQPPFVPSNLLALASVTQAWGSSRVVKNDGVRVVPMSDLAAVQSKIDHLAELLAQERLTSDANTRESGTKKGLFVDPFLSDSMRDAGTSQTAAIINGELSLPVTVAVSPVSADIGRPKSLAYTWSTAFEQVKRTGSMPVNPYQSFAMIPADVSISPASDQWTDYQTAWTSPVTQSITVGTGSTSSVTSVSNDVLLSQTQSTIAYLRQIDISFAVEGFGPGETLQSVKFDGIVVVPRTLGGVTATITANAAGRLTGKITIPANVPAGTKRIECYGSGGSVGFASFFGQGVLDTQTFQKQTTITTTLTATVSMGGGGGGSDAVVPPAPEVNPTVEFVKSMYETYLNRSYDAAGHNPAGLDYWVNQINNGMSTANVAASFANSAEAQALNHTTATVTGYVNNNDGSVTAAYSNGTTNTFQKCNIDSAAGADPLAQTFVLDSDTQLVAVDLWFATSGMNGVVVQVRETSSGFPTRVVLGEARLMPDMISLNGATRAVFSAAINLLGGVEYAVVVMGNDAETTVAIAELGKYDSAAASWVTSQPYQVGVLLSSSNASTWTAHQDRDLTFRLVSPAYTQTSTTINLGTVAVTAKTDLMLRSLSSSPSASAYVAYTLTLPDASTVSVADGQPIRLPAAITGNVGVTATLHGTPDSSPVLFPGTQLVHGVVSTTGDYVTRAIPAGNAARVRVIFEAILPSGASVAVSAKGIDVGDTYTSVPFLSSSQVGDGWIEMIHELSSISEAYVQVKLLASGTSAARPRLRKLRVVIL